MAALRSAGMPTTVRDTRGREIDGACGQLAARLTPMGPTALGPKSPAHRAPAASPEPCIGPAREPQDVQ